MDYVDGFYADNGTPEDNTDDTFDRGLAHVLPGQVQGSTENMAPEFEEGATAMRYVRENSPRNTIVGLPVVAKDPGDTPNYMLSGADAGSFDIGLTTAQITVSEHAELDHETRPTYMVTVTATDLHSDSADIILTIHVTDMDEGPAAMQYIEDIDHTENDTAPVITLTATDPEEVSPILWSVLDDDDGPQDIPGEDGADNVASADIADRDLFEVSAAGVLAFVDAPNFENDRSSANSGENQYKVVVQASDGTRMSWFKVAVMVTDVEEEGSVKLRPGD